MYYLWGVNWIIPEKYQKSEIVWWEICKYVHWVAGGKDSRRTDAGCSDSVSHPIVIREETTFYAPSAFSPGSGFQNNYFYPKGVGIDEDNYQLIIYDRWGEVIYETDVYPEGTHAKSEVASGWNGKWNNSGDYVKVGVYTWYCKFKTVYGEERDATGAVTVIR